MLETADDCNYSLIGNLKCLAKSSTSILLSEVKFLYIKCSLGNCTICRHIINSYTYTVKIFPPLTDGNEKLSKNSI